MLCLILFLAAHDFILVMHRQEILPIIHIIADLVFIFTQIPHVFGKIVIFKTLFWPYFMKTMSSGSVKLIGRLIS